MSTTQKQRTTFIPAARLSFAHILRSEFIKLTSLRSSVLLLLSIIVFGGGVALVLALTAEGAGLPDAPSVTFMLDEVTVGTVLFGQLIAGVLGVLVISSEYSSGTIQSTLIAAPTRMSVLAAKAIVVFVATTAAAAVALFGSWAVTYAVYTNFGIQVGLEAPGVLTALIGAAVYVGLSSVLGLGVGALLRAVAAGVVAVTSIIFLLPIVLSVLPASQTVRNVHMLTMSKAGDSMASAPEPGFLDLVDGYVSTGAGWLIAAVWAGVFLVAGAVRLRRGDA